MYEKMSPKQQNALIWGSRLRTIGAIKGLLGNGIINGDLDPFTQEERNAIQDICTNAHHRAKEAYQEGCKRLAEASCGAEAEQRQYAGK